MYKKYAAILLMFSLITGIAFLITEEKTFVEKLGKMNEEEVYEASACIAVNGYRTDVVQNSILKIVCGNENISGNHPVLEMQSVKKECRIVLSEEDKMILYKIVEAEAGGEDRRGKILVANVILNRLEHESFPDSIEEVVFQQKEGVAQFSPVANGKYEKSIPTEDTIEAVTAALEGEDYSQGALYFMARNYADENNIKWFDTHLNQVLAHGGHEFFK